MKLSRLIPRHNPFASNNDNDTVMALITIIALFVFLGMLFSFELLAAIILLALAAGFVGAIFWVVYRTVRYMYTGR